MSKRDKILKKWRQNTPKEEKLETVLAVINYYFEGYRQRGSHIIVEDTRLDEEGIQLILAIKNGQKIKGFYLRRIANIIKELEF